MTPTSIQKFFLTGIFFFLMNNNLLAQCLFADSVQGGSLSAINTQPLDLHTCMPAGQFSSLQITAPGMYYFSANIPTDYITVTDMNNSVIHYGRSPLAVPITAAGAYRMHLSANRQCQIDSTCRLVRGEYLGTLTDSSKIAQIGFGTPATNSVAFVPTYRVNASHIVRYNRGFTVFTQHELQVAGISHGAEITELFFEKTPTGGTIPGKDYAIRLWMRHGNMSLPLGTNSWANLLANSTQVMNASSWNITETDRWVRYSLDTPFLYQGGNLEMAFENEISGAAPFMTGALQWVHDTIYGTDYVIGSISTSNTFNDNLGSAISFTQRPNTRFQYVNTKETDAALLGFVSPGSTCASQAEVIVSLGNTGSQPIDSVFVSWTLNGNPQSGTAYLGFLGVGDTAHLHLGSFPVVSGAPYDIVAFITGVGAGVDTTFSNDTIQLNGFTSAMSGIYTINPLLPASPSNFQSIDSAINTLVAHGVCGPTILHIAPGQYNQQVVVPDISGASSINTITFKGAGQSSVIWFTPTITDQRHVIRLDGASHIILDSLTIKTDTLATFGWAVHLTNGAHDIVVKQCTLDVRYHIANINFRGVVVNGNGQFTGTGASGFKNLWFEDNYFLGGFGVQVSGLSVGTDGPADNLTFQNNIFSDLKASGIQISQARNVLIKGNIMSAPNGMASSGNGINLIQTLQYQIIGNEIYEFGQTGINIGQHPAGVPPQNALIANNAISGIRGTGTIAGGILIFGASASYIDIVHNSVLIETGTGAALRVNSTASQSIRILNNSFVHTGGGHAMHINNTVSVLSCDHNLYFTGNTPFVFYNGSNRTTLAALQSVNTPFGNDINSISGNPLYLSNTFLYPQNPVMSNAAMVFPGVDVDITETTRANPPDIGAYEFAPISGDIQLMAGGRVDHICYTSSDSLFATLVNITGLPLNLVTNPISVHWNITGPVNANGTLVFSSGTFAVEDTLTAFFVGVDFSVLGDYTLDMYIDSNAFNNATSNDTLNSILIKTFPDLWVQPKTIYIDNPVDTAMISANSRFFPVPQIYISEIVQQRSSANGFPVGGWPSYLLANNYIEITGPPNADISGILLEQWNAVEMLGSYRFPRGTILSPEGTAIIAVGGVNFSVEQTDKYYYHGNGDFAFLFTGGAVSGRILKAPNDSIIDAVWYGMLNFPAAAGVSSADWSGTIPSTFNVGVKLDGSYTKTALNWSEMSATNPATPNILNVGIVNPPQYPALPTLTWLLDGAFHDDHPVTHVGPFSAPGTYLATVSIPTPCGVRYDTVTIIVDFLYCEAPDSILVIPACSTATVSWISAGNAYDHDVEYGPAGFVPGSGTRITNVTSPTVLTGLSPGQVYDVYVTDHCEGYFAAILHYDSTYAPAIQSFRNVNADTSTLSSCAGTLSVNIPMGATIDSVSLEYSITAGTGMYISGSLSYLRCVSSGGNAEPQIYWGSPTNHPGTGIYKRSGLNIANNVSGGGLIDFELHNFRNEFSSGCISGASDVDPNSFSVTIFTTDTVYHADSITAAPVSFTTDDFPNAGIPTFQHNGSGGYSFQTTQYQGSIRWNFGDGNNGIGDSVFHQYQVEGNYTVIIIAENSCGSDTAILPIAYVSVESYNFDNISVFPNPSIGVITIESLPTMVGEITFQLNDVQGRTVFTKIYSELMDRVEINIESLRAGTYFLKISNNAGQSIRPIILIR
ncbi:MAG: right-handed parallel beta-helix repeat-containing protein [Cryomorphaceae bacterium]|nr:right-handed parallel beta-helix repeat-containing protein [Cryomorphaceae bacterium]